MAPKARNVCGEKNKRSNILLTDKVKILQDMEQGMSSRLIMRKYNIKCRSTVSSIKRAKEYILSTVAEVQGNICKKV